MRISNHASSRIRERCGLPKKAVERNAENALSKGLTREECTGKLQKYFDYLYLSHGIGANIRLYGNHVYIFTHKQLITVLPLPNAHRKLVKKAMLKRDKNVNAYSDSPCI